MKVVNAGAARTAGAVRHRRIIEYIRLLCHSGAGLEALAGPLCQAVRDVIGADSVAVFWVDATGAPAGFFHDCAPPELKDLFVTRFDELFGAPDQITMLNFIGERGPPIGKTLEPGFMDRWLKGNIHHYLCVPLNHHHMLDMRIDRDGTGHAAFFAWNPEDRPFTQADVALWEPVRRMVEHAAQADTEQVKWLQTGEGLGHFITDLSGAALIAIHPEAETFLKNSHLLRQNISLTRRLNAAPSFAVLLARQLAEAGSATLHVPIANGRLAARASYTRGIGDGGTDMPMMYVSLHREVAQNMLAAEYLMLPPLTPFQREIALFALTGGQRRACREEFGVSDEALKKHMRSIFSATGTAKWADLAAMTLPAI